MPKYALISVSDKTGLIPLAKKLVDSGYSLLSTGGTAQLLKDENLPVTLIEAYTGFPEILDGRVKTLQPKIHAGILANRALESHQKEIQKLGFNMIDVVIANLYPFQSVTSKKNVTLADAIENIDIGGVTLLRAAAKNYQGVTIICDPTDYPFLIDLLDKPEGISLAARQKLAIKAFGMTRDYDTAIAEYLNAQVDD